MPQLTTHPDYYVLVFAGVFAVILAVIVGVLMAKGYIRFTLRTLLIATTLVAVVLGLIVYVTRD